MSIMSTFHETVTITVEEFARLKDIETRFTVLKNQMLHAEYCPIHTQVILGIEKEIATKKELKLDMAFNMDDGK